MYAVTMYTYGIVTAEKGTVTATIQLSDADTRDAVGPN